MTIKKAEEKTHKFSGDVTKSFLPPIQTGSNEKTFKQKFKELFRKNEDKTIKGDLVLNEDMVVKGNLVVEGNIYFEGWRRYSLTVKDDLIVHGNVKVGKLKATNINVDGNMDTWDIISKGDVTAKDIFAHSITASKKISVMDLSIEDDIRTKILEAKSVRTWGRIFCEEQREKP